ncbi:MAG: hypothetical protein HN377_05360 [Alphaproteobacteria bacterium]|jgi:hypothetical protein|nr:hypothetical protein [Alphaproteobacteria bacterium]MBT7941963.1 hypothetical protein [Alphaproteobacteria bacterium]
MEIRTITAFFKYCTIINVVLFILSAIMILAAPDFIYSMHGQWFSIPRESFNLILYGFLGIYKIFILIFNLVPLIALLIIGTKENRTMPGT